MPELKKGPTAMTNTKNEVESLAIFLNETARQEGLLSEMREFISRAQQLVVDYYPLPNEDDLEGAEDTNGCANLPHVFARFASAWDEYDRDKHEDEIATAASVVEKLPLKDRAEVMRIVKKRDARKKERAKLLSEINASRKEFEQGEFETKTSEEIANEAFS